MSARNESEETVRLMRSIAAHREQSDRYRLAWMSARNRARSYATDLEAHMDWSDDMQDERDALRSEVAQLGKALVVQQRDDARAALERVAVERDEARAEVVRLGKENEDLQAVVRVLRATLRDATAPTTYGGEAYVAVTIDTTPPDEVSAATDRLRTALAEDRIEPEPEPTVCFNCGEAIWRGVIWVHRSTDDALCKDGSGSYAEPGRTEGGAP